MTKKGCLITIVIICVLCLSTSIVIGIQNPPAPASKPTLFDPIQASVECEYAIRSQLKSPSTANFIDDQVFKVKGKPDSWHYVEGVVDAQNSFGALIRTSYLCVVVNHGEYWTIEETAIN